MTDTEKLRERMDKDALAGLHRVIPAFKGINCEPIDAYLTSAEINGIIAKLLQTCKDVGLVFRGRRYNIDLATVLWGIKEIE